MKWVTWQNVGVDRMGCAWLIRKYLDPAAEFLFIPEGTTDIPPDAEPFDIPGVRLSHHRGHCSFHAILQKYKISDPVLDHISQIIDEADIVHEVTLEPSAPGLDLLCRGIRLVSADDNEAFRARIKQDQKVLE